MELKLYISSKMHYLLKRGAEHVKLGWMRFIIFFFILLYFFPFHSFMAHSFYLFLNYQKRETRKREEKEVGKWLSLWILNIESNSYCISWCKIVQNGKMCSFYTIWAKKPPTSARANLCINASCYSTRANMHRYCSMRI